MYLRLRDSVVLEVSNEQMEGWYYTNKQLSPPPLKVGERAYIRYDKDIDEFYYVDEKGEVI